MRNIKYKCAYCGEVVDHIKTIHEYYRDGGDALMCSSCKVIDGGFEEIDERLTEEQLENNLENGYTGEEAVDDDY